MPYEIISLLLTILSSLVAAAPINMEEPFNLTLVNQTDFDIKEFSGIWYTVWKSKNFVQDGSLNIKSKVFYPNARGNISFLEMDVRNNKFCSGQETVMEHKNDMFVTDENVAVRIIMTDYNSTALLMYCTNFTESTCHQDHYYFEINSRSPVIEPDDEVRILMKIDEISGRHEEMTYLGADCDGDNAIFDSIPISTTFSLKNVLGDSFALAQSDFTTTNALMAHNIYLPQNDHVAGWFTILNEKGECGPVMRSMSKTNSNNTGIVYSRIGHFHSQMRWNIMKTLYSDEHYTLSYFCFGQFNLSCPRNFTEIRLDSRKKDIEPSFKRTMFQLLQKVCLTANNMKDIQYGANCSSVLKEVVDKEQKQFMNTADGICRKENMPLMNSHPEKGQLDGIWYNIASNTHMMNGIIMNFTTSHDFLLIDACLPRNGICEWVFRTKAYFSCPKKGKLHELMFPLPGNNSNLISEVYLAYIDSDIHIVYGYHNITDGVGSEKSLLLNIHSRQKHMTDEILEKVKNFLPFLCLNISQLKINSEFPSFNFSEYRDIENYQEAPCSLESISSIEYLNQSKILGIWYELAHSDFLGHIGKTNQKLTHRVQFTEDKYGQLVFQYQHEDMSTEKSGAFLGAVQHQCDEHYNGDFLAQNVIVKILYTDYENLTIVFACSQVFTNGECVKPMVHILGRKPQLTVHILNLTEPVLRKACIAPDNLLIIEDVSTKAVSHSCKTMRSREWRKRGGGRHGGGRGMQGDEGKQEQEEEAREQQEEEEEEAREELEKAEEETKDREEEVNEEQEEVDEEVKEKEEEGEEELKEKGEEKAEEEDETEDDKVEEEQEKEDEEAEEDQEREEEKAEEEQEREEEEEEEAKDKNED